MRMDERFECRGHRYKDGHVIETDNTLMVIANTEYREVRIDIDGDFDCCSGRDVTLYLEDAKRLYNMLGTVINQLEEV